MEIDMPLWADDASGVERPLEEAAFDLFEETEKAGDSDAERRDAGGRVASS